MLRCSRAARDIRFNVPGQSKIYLRPIQVKLSTEHQTRPSESNIKETCKICNKLLPISELRAHFTKCSDFDYGSDKSSNLSDEDEQRAQSLQHTVNVDHGTSKAQSINDIRTDNTHSCSTG